MSKVDPLLRVRYAKGKRSLGKVQNLWTTWGEFKQLFKVAKRLNETFAEYEKLGQDDRAKLKNANGYWFAAHGEEGRRRLAQLSPRELLTLDVDKANRELPDLLEHGLTAISGYEFIAHPTLSSSKRKPRYRLVVPMNCALPTEDFRAACTVFAWHLDPSLEQVDHVSFRPAQMMFRPVVAKDATYSLIENSGDLLDPYQMLADWGQATYGDPEAWRDWSKLPYSESQGQIRQSAKKAEVPTEKKGIVGAFCRAYDVEAAIAEFIPDVYVPGETHATGKPRYTYAYGSGSNGVVVEDDGLFIFSHHGTDPCGDRLVNSFDMVRLHRFAELDVDTEDDTPPGKFPSFKAMQALALDDPAVRQELLAERFDLEAQFDDADVQIEESADFESEPADVVDAELEHDPELAALIGEPLKLDADSIALIDGGPLRPPAGWLKTLDITEEGGIRATLPNVATIVQNDARTWGSIALNDFTGQIVARKDIMSKSRVIPPVRIKDKVNGDLWEDINDITIRAILESPSGKKKPGYGFKVSDRDLQGGVALAAVTNRFHPIKQFLDKLDWDGVERLETLLIRYLGTEDTPYHRDIIRLSLVAAVARVYEPGHKFDFAMILEGQQGLGKSTFIKALAMGRWFSELHGDVSDLKKMVEQMMGFWIMELPELAGIYRSEVADTKAFISGTADTVRLAYARRAIIWRRQCIFIGSTNDRKYLKDPSGNRRFWPVKVEVDQIDIPALLHEMPQVWAEARRLYLTMRAEQPHGTLPLYLQGHDSRLEALEKQEAARQETPEEELAGQLMEWLDRPVSISEVERDQADFEGSTMVRRNRVCGLMVWSEFFGETRQISYRDSLAISRALSHMTGWDLKPGRPRHAPYGQQRWLYRQGSSDRDTYRGYEVAQTAYDDTDELI